MAMFLNHWDNKATNQRLVCTSAMPPVSAHPTAADQFPRCDRPLAMMQDVGSTFGPLKVDLEEWRATPMWADPSACLVSMREFPYGGSTFPDVHISEAGRRLLADRLRQVSASRIRSIFEYARFRDIDGWVAAFEQRVNEIDQRLPCPT
jgi:hypothetical protein